MKKSLKTLLACALAATMVFSLAACGEKEEVVPETPDTPVVEMDPTEYVDVTTEDIVDTLIYTYGEDFNATQAIEPEVFAELTGVQPAMYDEYYAAMAPMSAHVDTVFVVKAAEGYIEEVHDLLNAYRDDLLADTMQYPMNVPKIEASIIEEYEAFVVFRMLGGMYEPETTETEATETEKVEVAEGEKTPEEKAAYDFYCAETNKGTDALIQLFDIGFTVNWTEEERMEKGIRIIEISKDNEFDVSGAEEVEATEDNEAEATETTEVEAEAEVAEPTETEEPEVAETESTETAEVAGEEKVDAEKVDENIAEEVVENKAEENTADGSAE